MTISGARVTPCFAERNFATLKIETDQGLTGLGDATLSGRELGVASDLSEHVMPRLFGRDAHRLDHIRRYLYKGEYRRPAGEPAAARWRALEFVKEAR